MQTSEQQKARLRAIQAPARAEGRGLTPEEDRALTDAVFSCIGRNITGDLDDACTARIASLLSALPGAAEGTRLWISDAWSRPTPRARLDRMAVGCIVWLEIYHGVTPDDIDLAMSERWVTAGEGEIPSASVVRLQGRITRHWRLLNRLVRAGCLRREEA